MTPARVALFTVGSAPHTVNGWRERLSSGRAVVRIEWREPRRKTKTWDDAVDGRRIARAYAKGVNDRLQRRDIVVHRRLTVEQLFEKFVVAMEADWRPKTRLGKLNTWRLFESIVGANTSADLVTEETLDEVRKALRTRKPRPIVPNQIQKVVALVKTIWAWARRRRLIAENVLAGYENKLPKDGGALDVPEYAPDEAERIFTALSNRSSRTWRTWAAILLAAILAPRQNALLNLEWPDVDLDARTVRWRGELDKLGRERVQPLPREAVYVLRCARIWRARRGYLGRFVFFHVQPRRGDHPWTYSALNAQLAKAERAAGVSHVKYRAMHGFRRMSAYNILKLSGGDLNAALDWLGDTDLRTLKRSYLKQRPDELRSLADKVHVLPTKNRAVPTPLAEAMATGQQSTETET